eukprot:GHVS01012494.1.p1 GENE.GHVS01012494.1~~GHVS01012494.1.p1  ORF type:complete len:352 (+),score=42.92 GHVS01012494.1:182-1237(+)
MAAEIGRIDEKTKARLCSDQVVVDLKGCIKELLENAVDAEATSIEIRLRASGVECVEVADNGTGIPADQHELIARPHATSKIRAFGDIHSSLSTLGFRGEALGALSALGDLTVCTRTAAEAVGTELRFDQTGELTKQQSVAKEVGTTVRCEGLFERLRVRRMELMRGIKSHLAAAVAVVQAYAIILPHVRLHMTDRTRVKDKEKHVVLLSSPGHATSLRSSCACVLGERTTRDMLDFRLDDSNSAWSVEGLISKAQYGRKARDMQFYFINGRPVDAPKRIVKCVNDVFKQYSAKLYAVCVVHIRVAQSDVDVNVTPDKRSVFCVAEDELSESLSVRITSSAYLSPISLILS